MANWAQFLLLFLLLLFSLLQLHLCNSQSKCSTVGWHETAWLVLVIHQNKQLWGHPKPQGFLLQYESSEAVGAVPPDSPSYHQLKPSTAQCSKPSSASRVIKVSFKAPWLCLWWICLSTGACWAPLVTLLCVWGTQEGHSPRQGVQWGDSLHLPTQLRSCLLYPGHQPYWEAVGAALNSSFVSGHHVMGVATPKS